MESLMSSAMDDTGFPPGPLRKMAAEINRLTAENAALKAEKESMAKNAQAPTVDLALPGRRRRNRRDLTAAGPE